MLLLQVHTTATRLIYKKHLHVYVLKNMYLEMFMGSQSHSHILLVLVLGMVCKVEVLCLQGSCYNCHRIK